MKRAGFVAKTLESYGSAAVKTQKERIAQHTYRYSGILSSTPNVTDTVGNDDSGSLIFDVVNYHRFIDMRLSSQIYNNVFVWYYGAIAENLQYGYLNQAAGILNETLNRTID